MRVLLTLLLCLFGASALAQESAYERVSKSGVLRCGYMLWPQMHELDPNTGAMSGMMVETTEAMAALLGWKVEWAQEVLAGQQVDALKSGKIDMMCNADGPWITNSAAHLNFSRPIFFVPLYLMGRSEDAARFVTPTSPNSESVTFSAMDGDTSLQLAQQRFPKAKILSLPSSADPSLLLRNVVDKKADLVILDGFTAEKVHQTHPGKIINVWPEPMIVVASSYSLRKGEFDLWQSINQGLQMLEDRGDLGRILGKYDMHNTKMIQPQRGWQQARP
jgi:ABC-type amino acid transport substrate-binding protein